MTVTRIQHSRITGAGVVPVPADLARGELLLNLTDAALFTKDEADAVRSIGVPTGIITEWYGTAAQVPTGWALCDGTQGTPDLRDTFGYAAAIDADVGDTGGALTDTSSSDGDHDHGGNTGGTSINVNDLPAHTHKLFANVINGDSNPNLGTSDQACKGNNTGDNWKYEIEGTGTAATIGDSGSAGNDSTHNHSISNTGAHTHTVDTVPPYHRLYKIMKL